MFIADVMKSCAQLIAVHNSAYIPSRVRRILCQGTLELSRLLKSMKLSMQLRYRLSAIKLPPS